MIQGTAICSVTWLHIDLSTLYSILQKTVVPADHGGMKIQKTSGRVINQKAKVTIRVTVF